MSTRQTMPLLLLAAVLVAVHPAAVAADQKADYPAIGPAASRDGQHDFDFAFGTWKTRVSRRLRPLTGSDTWVEYQGTSVVRPVWNGAANPVELVMDGPAGHFEGMSLRLYNPDSKQWSLNFSNRAAGTMAVPTIGEFKNGQGEFYNQETLAGRVILVRFVISPVNADTYRYEQAFSGDGGKTWEVNWIATDIRLPAK